MTEPSCPTGAARSTAPAPGAASGAPAPHALPVATSPGSAPLRARELGLVFLVFAAVALLVYAPALDGPFVSDDIGYVLGNRYVHELSRENLKQLLDPRGVPAAYTANYAPVHLLAHALEWRAFGPQPRGYHVVNVLLHAGVATLLAALFADWGLRREAALAGAALFLLHPANVEAVAWIFQLKTVLALGLSVGALLWLPRRPAAATLLFGAALLTKVASVGALPAAAVLEWANARVAGRRPAFRWVAAWCALLALVAVPEWVAFERLGSSSTPLHADPLVALRSVVAFGARYLVMTATSLGVAAFQDPPRATSSFDPWWLLGVVLGVALTLRGLRVVREGSTEAACWTWAAAGWLPVSQVFPFLYPMADRYLYFIAPGLIGGALLALGPRRAPAWHGPRAARVALVLVAALALGFAVHAHARARLWRSEALLLTDAARHFPDGIEAQLLRANAAAQRGDAAATAQAVHAAAARGFDRFELFERHPAFAGVRDAPVMRDAIAEVAGRWIAAVERRERLNQAELHVLGRARLARGEIALAIRRLEEARALGGPWQDQVLASLQEARAAAYRERAAQPQPK